MTLWNVYRWSMDPKTGTPGATLIWTGEARHSPGAMLKAIDERGQEDARALFARPAHKDEYAKG